MQQQKYREGGAGGKNLLEVDGKGKRGGGEGGAMFNTGGGSVTWRRAPVKARVSATLLGGGGGCSLVAGLHQQLLLAQLGELLHALHVQLVLALLVAGRGVSGGEGGGPQHLSPSIKTGKGTAACPPLYPSPTNKTNQ